MQVGTYIKGSPSYLEAVTVYYRDIITYYMEFKRDGTFTQFNFFATVNFGSYVGIAASYL